MPALTEFLGAERVGEGSWRFHIPRELHGAFGGAFGGVVASCALVAARSAAPGRVPNALDCRFVRGLPAGEARAEVAILHAGRSLSTIAVDITDASDRLCTRATISLVEPTALSDLQRPGPSAGEWKAHSDAAQWQPVAPIVAAIDSRIVGNDERGIATAMKVPWDITPDSSAEAASMAADMAVGPPIGSAISGENVSGPNPDLSLRFCGEVTTSIVVGVGRLERAAGGVAAVSVEVWSAQQLAAVGICTALMLPMG